MSTLLLGSVLAAAEGKGTGYVSVLQHCDELQDIYRPLAVYHEEEYNTAPAIKTALHNFFGFEYNDRCLSDWRIILTIEL